MNDQTDPLHPAETASQYRYFSPWQGVEQRRCQACTHAIGYDGVHLWCQRWEQVVVMPCSAWEREPGCD